jgi:hypothetical protein
MSQVLNTLHTYETEHANRMHAGTLVPWEKPLDARQKFNFNIFTIILKHLSMIAKHVAISAL